MADDPATGRLVMFGGCMANGGGSCESFQTFNETWTYGGGTWTRLSPSVSPSPRTSTNLAYDPRTRQLILFGGVSPQGLTQRDTWAYRIVGSGYRFVAADGGVFTFDAPFYGSTGNRHLNQPIVGMAANPGTGGYWLVANDGGVFTFHAPFFGSAGNQLLDQPAVGIAAAPNGRGYWIATADGTVFNFGSGAPRYGAKNGSLHLTRPVVGIAADPTTGGYRLVTSGGGVVSFGAPNRGPPPNCTSTTRSSAWPPIPRPAAIGSSPPMAASSRSARRSSAQPATGISTNPSSAWRGTQRPGLLARRQRRRHIQLRGRRDLPRVDWQSAPEPTDRRHDRFIASRRFAMDQLPWRTDRPFPQGGRHEHPARVMTTELEAKLIPARGFRIPALDGMPSGSVTVVDPVRELDATYYDTPDLELARWGITLRHRRGESGRPWTLKLPGPASDTTLAREELTLRRREPMPYPPRRPTWCGDSLATIR